MNKWLAIGISISVSAFIGANAILLFSDKSIISKDVYVHEYERLASGNFEEALPKESLVAPLDIATVYVESEDTIQDWLVKVGDVVNVGDELATLNTSTADEQREVWESEKEALQRQVTQINSTITTLKSELTAASNSSSGNVTDNVTENTDDQTVTVDVNVEVEVPQDGAFAHAIAQAQQKLSEVNQQLQVVDAQLDQEGAAAIISPVDGVVSHIQDKNGRLAVEIYSVDKIVVTYATDEQFQQVQVDDRVRLQADGIEQSIEGTVTEVSEVPATDSEFLSAYKALDPKNHKNPLAYYEVRIQPKEPISNLPFGNNTNAMILVNEAQKAVSVQTAWLHNRFDSSANVFVVNKEGHAVKTPVKIAFDLKTRSVIDEGLKAGSVVVYEPQLIDYRYAPAIFFPMPMESPSWESAKSFGWKNYLKYLAR